MNMASKLTWTLPAKCSRVIRTLTALTTYNDTVLVPQPPPGRAAERCRRTVDGSDR